MKKDYSYLYVDDIKLAGKKQNINQMWKVLNQEKDLRKEEADGGSDDEAAGRQCESHGGTVALGMEQEFAQGQ